MERTYPLSLSPVKEGEPPPPPNDLRKRKRVRDWKKIHFSAAEREGTERISLVAGGKSGRKAASLQKKAGPLFNFVGLREGKKERSSGDTHRKWMTFSIAKKGKKGKTNPRTDLKNNKAKTGEREGLGLVVMVWGEKGKESWRIAL